MADRADWNTSRRAYLVAQIRDQVIRGKTSDTGLKSEAWSSILVDFNQHFGTNYGKLQVQNQYTRMKGEYKLYDWLRAQSGFGWNETQKIVVGDEGAWQEIIAVNPKVKKFKTKPFDLFVEMDEICSGHFATGSEAITGDELDETFAGNSGPRPTRTNPISSALLTGATTLTSSTTALCPRTAASTISAADGTSSATTFNPANSSAPLDASLPLGVIRRTRKRLRDVAQSPKLAMASAVHALAASTVRDRPVQRSMGLFEEHYKDRNYIAATKLAFFKYLSNNAFYLDIFNDSASDVRDSMVDEFFHNVTI